MAASQPPRLLVVAHGTRSASGQATTADLVAAVARARPELRVDLCFLDVATPTLGDALDGSTDPTVAVPLLLSTGQHVQHDIPAAASGRAQVRVARHLGPHPLLAAALADRLAPVAGDAASTLLVAAGSSHPDAAAELTAAAALLAERVGQRVAQATMADDVAAVLDALPRPVAVATYLLAPGAFLTELETAAKGRARVAEPIGVHPALVELVLLRYDEAMHSR
jgi:sirohydrochlorin ferrochelatase